jgi:hypothetical protein
MDLRSELHCCNNLSNKFATQKYKRRTEAANSAQQASYVQTDLLRFYGQEELGQDRLPELS